ncbi:MAG TPA: hypothetical protein VF352_03635 [Anaerolineales bacterium]
MFWKKLLAIIASVFLTLTSACNMPGGTAVGGGPNQDPTAAIQTQAAGIVASTAAAQTAFANAMASTLAAMATNTPEFTFTPSLTPTPTFTLTPFLTPTPTFTLTPEVPTVSVSVNTYCRSGPGPTYDILGIVNVGQNAEVVGRNASSDTWVIKLPSNPAINCWLWGQYATVVGNTAGLPVITPPPTPTPAVTNTPAASFMVVYSSIENCGIGAYAIKFKITNNGPVTWESNRVIATDQVSGETNTVDRNDFPNLNNADCALLSADLNLEAREVGYTSSISFVVAPPAGHNFTATIRVCSLNGMAGTCLEKTITFTP